MIEERERPTRPLVRAVKPMRAWEVWCCGGCFPTNDGFGEVMPTWVQAMELAYGHLAMHHGLQGCSC